MEIKQVFPDDMLTLPYAKINLKIILIWSEKFGKDLTVTANY